MNTKKNEAPIKRWTAKRRTALVLEILRGQTTVQDASRKYDLKISDIQHWRDEFLSAGENALRSKPREEMNRLEDENRRLKQKVGELVMDVDILKYAHSIHPSMGSSSDE